MFNNLKKWFSPPEKLVRTIKCFDEGFVLSDSKSEVTVNWKDVNKIVAYKVDLITIDEIRLDVFYKDDMCVIITEEDQGYAVFSRIMKEYLHSVLNGWEYSIIKPAFERNETIIYSKFE